MAQGIRSQRAFRWVDITGSIDQTNNWIDSASFNSLSPFAVAESAINASGTPEPSTFVLALLCLAGLKLTRRSRRR